MILRSLVFVVVAVLGYVATVAGAFVFWDITGASGPDYTPLLVVLFGLAPAVGLALGVLALRRTRKAVPLAEPPEPGRGVGRGVGRAAEGPVITRRNGPVQWAIALVVTAAVAAVLMWLGDGRMPYIPHFTP